MGLVQLIVDGGVTSGLTGLCVFADSQCTTDNELVPKQAMGGYRGPAVRGYLLAAPG